MKHRYKVLIVDNMEEAIDTFKNLLEGEGYQVEIAPTAAEAFEKIQNDKFHIALINTVMPDMDGLALLKKIKNYDPLTQVIMTAEDPSMDVILGALEYGANDYIYKPLDNQDYIIQVMDVSAQKLERWRHAIQQIVT